MKKTKNILRAIIIKHNSNVNYHYLKGRGLCREAQRARVLISK